MLNVFTKFYNLKKNNVSSCLICQSIIDKLKDHYWNMGAGNEWWPGNELGAQRAEQLYFNPCVYVYK